MGKCGFDMFHQTAWPKRVVGQLKCFGVELLLFFCQVFPMDDLAGSDVQLCALFVEFGQFPGDEILGPLEQAVDYDEQVQRWCII